MATDQQGRTVSAGDTYLLAGKVRRVETGDLLVVLGNAATSAQRVKPGDLLRVDDLIVTSGARPFTGQQQTSYYPTADPDIVPKIYVDLANIALIAAASSLFQPIDATLTALAGLTIAADKLIYGTGTDAFATSTLTSFMRTLLDDADAATARSTLGLGSLATLSTVGTSELTASAVTFAKIQNSAAAGCSVIGRSANSAGVFAEVAASSDDLPLRRKSNVLGFGTLVSTTALTTSATDVLLGRSSAGAGAVQQISCGANGRALIALSGTAGDGTILYYTHGAWTMLAAGTDGQVLTLSGGLPIWKDLP